MAEGNQVPDVAVTINIKGEPYKVDLNDGDFYKIIEIVPPDGYEGSNLTFTDEYPDLKSLLIAYWPKIRTVLRTVIIIIS